MSTFVVILIYVSVWALILGYCDVEINTEPTIKYTDIDKETKSLIFFVLQIKALPIKQL